MDARPALTRVAGAALARRLVRLPPRGPCELGGSATRKAHGGSCELAPFAGPTVPWHVLHEHIDAACSPADAP